MKINIILVILCVLSIFFAYSQYTQELIPIALSQMRIESPTSDDNQTRIESPTSDDNDKINEQQGPNGCLIATAAFGSELSPQVQFLRDFRDRHIMSTVAGSSFMNVFNSWYYTFSPYVANLERQNPIFQEIVKVSIYPLLNILQISEKFYSIFPGEFGAILAGLSASSIIGLIYFTPILLLSKKIRKEHRLKKILSICAISLVFSILLTILLDQMIILMVTTSILVITTLTISAILFTRSISLIGEKYIIKYLK